MDEITLIVTYRCKDGKRGSFGARRGGAGHTG